MAISPGLKKFQVYTCLVHIILYLHQRISIKLGEKAVNNGDKKRKSQKEIRAY